MSRMFFSLRLESILFLPRCYDSVTGLNFGAVVEQQIDGVVIGNTKHHVDVWLSRGMVNWHPSMMWSVLVCFSTSITLTDSKRNKSPFVQDWTEACDSMNFSEGYSAGSQHQDIYELPLHIARMIHLWSCTDSKAVNNFQQFQCWHK